MLTLALIILAFLVAVQTVRAWGYKKLWKGATTANTALLKAWHRARVEQVEEWPEIIK
jgi:uncharacterized membrane protein